VEREDVKHSLYLAFPENKELEVYFNNRARNDLPANIKGVGAIWQDKGSVPEGTYTIKVQEKVYEVKYINDGWYYTYYSTPKGQYSVIAADLIKHPHQYSLGTKSLPFETREDKPQESPEEESPQTTKRSEEDEPVTTQEAQKEVGQLAYQLHRTDLEESPLETTADIHGYKAAHQIYQEMATAAMMMTEEQQQQPIQWTYQAAPPSPPMPPQQLLQQPQQPPQQPGGGAGGQPGGGGGGGPPGGGPQWILPIAPQQPGQPRDRGSNGGLQGREPDLYTRDRKKTHDWIHQFNIFQFSNMDKEAIRAPLQCIAIALGYFRGEKVIEWARQQLELANRQVFQDGMDMYNERLWDYFWEDFLHTWRDTSILEDAQMKLDKLAMGKDITLEDYIAKFNACITELQWTVNHPGTV